MQVLKDTLERTPPLSLVSKSMGYGPATDSNDHDGKVDLKTRLGPDTFRFCYINRILNAIRRHPSSTGTLRSRKSVSTTEDLCSDVGGPESEVTKYRTADLHPAP